MRQDHPSKLIIWTDMWRDSKNEKSATPWTFSLSQSHAPRHKAL